MIYNNEETSEVDPNITPVLINTIDAEETNDSLPKLSEDDSETSIDTQSTQPYYTADKEKANSTDPALHPVYAKSAEDAGEVGGKTDEEETEDSDWDSIPTEQESEEGAAEEADEEADAESETSSAESSADDGDGWSDVDASGTGGDQGDGEGEGTDGGEGEGGGDNPSTSEDTTGGGGGTGSVYTGDADSDPEIPENIDEVAAVGNVAVIVAMVSGTAEGSSLVACDEDTKEKTAGLLAERGIGKAKALWSDDGDALGDMSDDNFETLLSSACPDLVFVTEGDSPFTDAQIASLQENNIDLYYLPKLTSAKRIRFAVQVVGMILAKGGVEGAEESYNAYLDYEKSLVDRYSNGCFAGGYNFDTAKTATAPDETYVSLLIDKWDENARYASSKNSGLIDTSTGVAVATLGYKTTPVNYYLSAGGVLNNAAAKAFRTLSGTGIVWQFMPGELGFNLSLWNGVTVASYDLSRKVTGGAYKADLLWNTTELAGVGYGTEFFPAVIASSQAIEQRFVDNAQLAGSGELHKLYSPYPVITPAAIGYTLGFLKDEANANGTYVESCIGRIDKNSGLSQASSDYLQVYVNPKGLCQADSEDDLCSWTAGSVESVLEASWAYWKFKGGNESDFRSDVIDFYNTFYGYDVADELDVIIAGAES